MAGAAGIHDRRAQGAGLQQRHQSSLAVRPAGNDRRLSSNLCNWTGANHSQWRPNGKPLPTGAAPPADGSVLYQTPTLPTVTIGGIATKVLYSGLAPGFPGLYQVDVQVPSGVVNGDDVPVVITMGPASDSATISIQPRP